MQPPPQGRPLRLLMVINVLAPFGGAEVQLGNLARGLSERGHEVTICCMDHSLVTREELLSDGVELIELRRRTRGQRPAALPRLVQLARQADVVHCTMWDPSLWGRIAAIIARRPAIVADHATDRKVQVSASGAPRASWIALHNRLLDRFTFATVACAQSQRPVLIGEGVAPLKIVYIPNGISVEEIRAAAASGATTRKMLGIPEDFPLVVQVGLFRPEKNQLGALEALAAVREQVPNTQLAFVGAGPTQAEVEERAAEMGASGWVHFLGSRKDAPSIMALADLSILPSISDAMPMTVLESMAVGTPLLATDVGDVRETLGDAGLCVPAEEPRALAAECVSLLKDEGRRAAMAAAGSERARDFDAAAMVDRYEALFRAAVSGTPPSTVA
ncbi:MAG TPA: glycosyltransferase [Solirubrobacterales bacterium]